MKLDLRNRLRNLIKTKVLGVQDTPHRIAFGVFLGLLIGWTPTLGFQILIYLAVATLMRANKVSGVPFVFISNPVTAGPLYYSAWVVGAWLLHLGSPPREPAPAEPEGIPQEVTDSIWDIGVTEIEFWSRLWHELAAVGIELWLGSLVMGIVTGVPAYILTHRAVRRARAKADQEAQEEHRTSNHGITSGPEHP